MKIALNLLIIFFSIFPFVYNDHGSRQLVLLGALSILVASISIIFTIFYQQNKKENYKIISSLILLFSTPLILHFIFVSDENFSNGNYYEGHDSTTPLLLLTTVFYLTIYYVLTDGIKLFK